MEGNASVYQVYPVSRITGEGRAQSLRAWGPRFDQEGAEGRKGQLKLVAETINPLRGCVLSSLSCKSYGRREEGGDFKGVGVGV